MVQPVDLLLTNAIVLTMDQEFHLYEPGAVAVTGEKIVAVGIESDIKAAFKPRQTLDCGGKALLPGLINAHTHTPMTLLRGLADDLRLDVWLMGYMMPVEREFVSPGFVRDGTLLACAEMIRSGVTTFADMYYFESDIAQAAADAGMRALCGESILKFPSPDSASYEDALAYTREFIKKWKGHPLITPVIAPHAYYTNTEKSLEDAAALAVEFDVPLHTHISETAQEVENARNDLGMPVVPFLKKHNLFNAKVIGAHCVHIDEGEMRTMIHAGASAIHNPSSNLKLASGIAPVNRMLELGMNVGIGTDGTASNNDLDMFEEIRLASFIAKVSTGDPTVLPARTALLMATRMGAQALHMGDQVGSLEPGKLADLILIDITPLHNSPRFRRDPNGVYAQIIYASKATDVTDVMIHGRWVMQDRQLTTIQEAELLQKSAEYARQIDAFLIKRENSVLSKLIAIGDASEEESFEVQTKVRIDDIQPVLEAIRKPEIEIERERLYREYDVYFKFDTPDQGYIRYREDHFVEANGEVSKVRLRLTHIGPTREHRYPQKVLLSRSRYLAPARQSLRFYREYFKPDKQIEIEKERRRFLVRYKDTEFFVNIDTLTLPALGKFLEVKSRTWSQSDAKMKSKLISELIHFLGASTEHAISQDYIEMIQ
jgi:5-methylthioadenosine/S-adenosylhomocysteine deaminase